VKPEKAMDNAGARERARFEATQRAAQSLSLTYRVRGWRQRDGALWAKNTIVQVVDPRRGFFGSDMLISKVTLGLDENGRIADLTVDPVAAYEVEKTLIAKGSGGRWFGSIEGKDLTSLTPEQIRATGDKP
jgi:prophage tail gpP-like protein